MASNEQHLQTIFDNISRCIKEYGMKTNGKKERLFVKMELRKRGVGILVGVKLVRLKNISI